MNVRLSNKVSFQKIGGELFVFKEPSGDVMRLNKTAEIIFMMIVEGSTIAEVKDRYSQTFSISAEIADDDVEGVISTFKEEGMVETYE